MTTVILEFAPTTTTGLAAGPSPRTLAGLALPFGVPSGPSADGERYMFQGGPRNPDDLVDVVYQHDPDALIGRLSKPWDITEAGMNAEARVFETSRGNDALTEAREGARASFSLGVEIHQYSTGPDNVRTVTDWTAQHLGVVRRPAFTQTTGITVHAQAQEEPMTTTTPPAPPATPPVVELPTIAELAAQVAQHIKQPDPISPLAQFESFTDFTAAFMAGDEDKRQSLAAAFAVPDQTIADSPGLKPPGWRNEIKMHLDTRRPAISAFGQIGLPDSGMDSNWPYLDPTTNLDGIIAEQAAEKDELAGVKLKVLKATAPIKTAGTVSDISYQLLMRGTPSYLAAYLRISMAAWARYTEAKFEAFLLANGTNVGALSKASADAFATQLFTASMDVQDATGAPADVVLVDKATFITAGGWKDMRNPKYGTQNLPGTASAATLRIDVNGLDVRYGPFLPANTMIVANSDAAKFASSGPLVASAENVARLGRDVAVWGMYEDGETYYPAGIRVYKPAA